MQFVTQMIAAATRRVVITGLGLVTPLGNSPLELWEALVNRKSGVAAISAFSGASFPSPAGGEARAFTGHIDNFGPLEPDKKKMIRKALKMMCREIQMGVAAAQMALENAGLTAGKYDSTRTGVTFGTDYIMTIPEEFSDGVRACMGEGQAFDFGRWGAEGLRKVDPLWLLKYLPNMPASHIAIYNDLRGPSNSITHREASANLSLAEAFCTIQRGSADTILAGATGTRIHPIRTVHVNLQEQVAANGMEPARLSRPFDRMRSGMVVGEGAAALVLEELELAQSRGAKIYGEIIGYGSSTVIAKNGVADRRTALANVMRQALRTSRLSPDQVGHIHAHGLSTRSGDAEEAAAIGDVFGTHAHEVPVVAAKGNFGNLGAASGAVELIASLKALEAGHLFPALNYDEPDSECAINVITSNTAAAGDTILNMNVTPQGQASAIVVRKLS